jgi:hypothetical protein
MDIVTTHLPEILLYALGMGALLILFLPFSPMTIDLVMLPRGGQIWVYRHRHFFWSIATISFTLLLARSVAGLPDLQLSTTIGGLTGAAADPVWFWITSGTVAAMTIAFWSGYVPFVMTPPTRQTLVDIEGGDKLLAPDDVILGFTYGGDIRAYPRDAIARPHYFTDTVGGTSFTVSYCILCNSGVAFKNELNGKPLDLKCITAFNNNIIYQDKNSGNFIQQLDGSVFHGPDEGKALDSEPVVFTTWDEWKKLHPDTQLYYAPDITLRDKIVTLMLQIMVPIRKLAARTKPYHRISGSLDERLPAMSLVLGVERNGESCSYPLVSLVEDPVINDTVGGDPLVVLYNSHRDVAEVFSGRVNGRVLTFNPAADDQSAGAVATDTETGSTWDVTGTAVSGELKGMSLAPLPHFNKLFWFSWALFKPGTRVKVAA